MLHLLRRLLCGHLFFISGIAFADPVWVIVNELQYSEILTSIETPDNAFAASPIEISSVYLGSLVQEDQIEIKTSLNNSIDFQVANILSFPNGDIGWNAANNSANGLQTISMTAGAVYFLASIVTSEDSYQVIAKQHPDQPSYIGWIYSEVRLTPPPINDDFHGEETNDFFKDVSILSIEEPALTITASAELVDTYYALIGEDLGWTFTITNSFGTATKALTLTVGGKYAEAEAETLYGGFYNFSDHSDFVSLPSNCKESEFTATDAFRKIGEITCSIDPVPANSSVSLAVKSRLKIGLTLDDLEYGALSYPSSYLKESGSDRSAYGSYSGYFSGPIPILDVLKDTDTDGISDFNENLLGFDAADKNSGAHKEVVIDVVVFYTKNFEEDISVDPETKINNAFTTVNEIFSGSNTGIEFNIVHYELLNYENNCIEERCTSGQRWNDTQTVMAEYGEKGKNQWRFSEKIRALKGADYVMILDGKGEDDPTAGQAASGTNNRGYFGFNKDKRTAFVHYGSWGYDIDEEVMAHELGHLFGMSHSRKQSLDTFGDNAKTAGTFPWATGHAVFDKFGTIMTYPSKFGIALGIKRFSDASRSDCEYSDPVTLEKIYNVFCGVDRSDSENGADAVGAMKITRYQHENFSPSRPVLATGSSDGKSYPAKFLAGAIKDIELGFKTTFKPSDAITAEGTINVAPEHIGKIGITHIIVDAGLLGAFQVNTEGQFVGLDLAAPNLVGSIAPRPLKGIEDLMVLNELIVEPLGVTSATLNVYFGYTVVDSGLLLYSAGPLTIQIAE